MIRVLLAGLAGLVMVAAGLVLIVSVTAGPAWQTPASLVGGFLLLLAGGTAMTWAVGA